MISIQHEDFDVGAEHRRLRACGALTGAVVTFTGLVREFYGDDPGQYIYLEHYPGMTERSLQAICEQAKERWELLALTVIHRIGNLKPGDQIVFAGAASKHRDNAFQACEFVMDYLKTRAPFWKKEVHRDGEHWVDAKQSDRKAAARWKPD